MTYLGHAFSTTVGNADARNKLFMKLNLRYDFSDRSSDDPRKSQ